MRERALAELTFDMVSEWLDYPSLTFDASEMHGSLCGVIASSYRVKLDDWCDFIFAELTEADVPDQLMRQQIGPFIDDTMESFTDANGVYDPLLPDDDEALSERVAALASWCVGFVYGLGLGGIEEPDKLPGVCGEIAQDLIEISGADFEEDSEDQEVAYSELVEFVRVASLLFLEELGQVTADDDKPQNKDRLN